MKKIKRRHFMKIAAAGTASMLTIPFFARAKSNQEEMNMESPVLKIQPLGFQWETKDPFLFCVHHEDDYPKGNEQMGPDSELLKGRKLGNDFVVKDGFRMYHGEVVPGFPAHPHKGFETVTVVREGLVDHADSMGGAGRYGNGDVQWMTAGKGVMHSEMFPLLKKDKGNPMELFQIWLNLPKKSKEVDGDYKMLWGESIPVHTEEDSQGKKTTIEVIAGTIYDKTPPAPPQDSWAHDAANDVAIWNINIEKNGTYTLPKASSEVNRVLYFYEGDSINIGGKEIEDYHSVEVKSDEDIVIQNKDHVSKILVLQGKPINEPVVQYGPFVMNTKKEIQEAYDEYNRTQFGGWPYSRYDHVHDRSKGRFAKYPDGSVETK